MSVLSLEIRYYRLVSSRVEGDSGVFRVELLPQCTVYQGHFPGRPVCPGVCHIELVRQCSEILSGQRLRLQAVSLARFPSMASPLVCPEVEVAVSLRPEGPVRSVSATIHAGELTFLEFKGEMSL